MAHVMSVWLRSKYLAIDGSAMFTMVASSTTMSCAPAISSSRRPGCTCRRAPFVASIVDGARVCSVSVTDSPSMSFEYGEPGAWLWLFTASIAPLRDARVSYCRNIDLGYLDTQPSLICSSACRAEVDVKSSMEEGSDNDARRANRFLHSHRRRCGRRAVTCTPAPRRCARGRDRRRGLRRAQRGRIRRVHHRIRSRPGADGQSEHLPTMADQAGSRPDCLLPPLRLTGELHRRHDGRRNNAGHIRRDRS